MLTLLHANILGTEPTNINNLTHFGMRLRERTFFVYTYYTDIASLYASQHRG
jgi:hypothetical protein